MKCNKCGDDVFVQPGKSANFCSNCGNKIEAEKASGWKYFDNTKELLAYIAAEYGLDALFSKKYLSDHASPMLPQGQKRLVSEAFSCGAIKILQDNMTADQQHKEIAVKQAAKKLTDLMFSQEAAEQIIWELANAIGWGMPEPSSVPSQIQSSSQPSNTPQYAPSPPVTPGTDALMTRAWLFVEDSDWKEATDYFNRVLDSAPTYAPAYLGLICVDLKASKADELESIKNPGSIINHKYYKRAVVDSDIKAQLDGYVQTIKSRIVAEQKAAAEEADRKRKAAEEAARKKRVQDAFDNACKIMDNAKSPDDYHKAITAFCSIDSNYQDISTQVKNKIVDCERLKKELEEAAHKKQVENEFASACRIMDNAQNPNDYRKAITAFSSIDGSFHDINNQIKSKIAECEKKRSTIETEYKTLLDRFGAENKAQAKERRKKEAQAKLDMENAKLKADAESECSRIQKKFDSDHKAWQEENNRLEAIYFTECKKWATETNAIKMQVERRNIQGVCPHCGGAFKGLLTKKCSMCGKAASDPIRYRLAPKQPNYPVEPRMPQMPTYTPRYLDPAFYEADSDIEAYIDGYDLFIKSKGIVWRVIDVQDGKSILQSDTGSRAFLDQKSIKSIRITVSIGESYSFGDIDWLVLAIENHKALLISEKILGKFPYHQPGGNITWENCTLRKGLNSEFYSKLGAMKSAIAETCNNNPNNQWYGTNGGNETIDKVFLLSLDEVCRYFGDSAANLWNKGNTGSDYYIDDMNNSTRIAYDRSEEASWWWLRSPGDGSGSAANVLRVGSVDVPGNNVADGSGGVRPALWINL